MKRSVYFGDPIKALLEAVGEENVSGALNATVARYLEVCKRSKPDLTKQELLACASAVWSTDTQAFDPRRLWANVEDALHFEGLAQTVEGFDGLALVSKLQAMDYAQSLAVLHEVESIKSKA
jgi:hypothetical protein